VPGRRIHAPTGEVIIAKLPLTARQAHGRAHAAEVQAPVRGKRAQAAHMHPMVCAIQELQGTRVKNAIPASPLVRVSGNPGGEVIGKE
jgi:hypothetical protein